MKTTFFIPGHSLETFPEECAMVRDAGHEMYEYRSLDGIVCNLTLATLTADCMAIRMKTQPK